MKNTLCISLTLASLLAFPSFAQDTVPQLTDDDGSKIEFKRTDAAVTAPSSGKQSHSGPLVRSEDQEQQVHHDHRRKRQPRVGL